MSSQRVLFTLTLLLITQLLYQAPLLQFYPPSVPWGQQDSSSWLLEGPLGNQEAGTPGWGGLCQHQSPSPGRAQHPNTSLRAQFTNLGPVCSTLTSAGKGSPAFLYQRKHSCLMQRASKLTETNLRCRFLVFRISAKPTPLWPSKQQLGSFQGRVCLVGPFPLRYQACRWRCSGTVRLSAAPTVCTLFSFLPKGPDYLCQPLWVHKAVSCYGKKKPKTQL